MKKNNFFKFLIPIVMVVIAIALIVIGVNYKEQKKEYSLENSLIVTTSFTASTPSNVIASRNGYMHIDGVVKNVSNTDLYDIVFKFDVRTPTTNEMMTYVINVDQIRAGESQLVTKSFQVTKHYTKITRLSFSVEGGEYITLSNLETKQTPNFMFAKPLLLFGGVAVFALAIMFMVVNIFKEKQLGSGLADAVEDLGDSLDLDLDGQEIFDLKSKLAKEKLKQELENIANSDWNCQYCGAKNDSKSSKCSGCGASKNK